jgi:hypothetical protein
VRAGAVVETELVGGRFTSRVEAIIDHTTEEDGD